MTTDRLRVYNDAAFRGVTQFGRVLGLGPRCRRFESCRLDQQTEPARNTRSSQGGEPFCLCPRLKFAFKSGRCHTKKCRCMAVLCRASVLLLWRKYRLVPYSQVPGQPLKRRLEGLTHASASPDRPQRAIVYAFEFLPPDSGTIFIVYSVYSKGPHHGNKKGHPHEMTSLYTRRIARRRF